MKEGPKNKDGKATESGGDNWKKNPGEASKEE